MKLTPIQVESDPEHDSGGVPRRFLVNDRWLAVEEILDRWYQVETLPEWPRADYFKIVASDQRHYLLKHDLDLDEWFLGQVW